MWTSSTFLWGDEQRKQRRSLGSGGCCQRREWKQSLRGEGKEWEHKEKNDKFCLVCKAKIKEDLPCTVLSRIISHESELLDGEKEMKRILLIIHVEFGNPVGVVN